MKQRRAPPLVQLTVVMKTNIMFLQFVKIDRFTENKNETKKTGSI